MKTSSSSPRSANRSTRMGINHRGSCRPSEHSTIDRFLLFNCFCRTSEEPVSRSLGIQRRRFSESQANLSIRVISDPLLLPTVVSLCYDCLASLLLYDTQYSIGIYGDAMEGRTTNACLLRSVGMLWVHRATLNLLKGTHSVSRRERSDLGTTSRRSLVSNYGTNEPLDTESTQGIYPDISRILFSLGDLADDW